ncbi:uncharacterized protein EDB91DRAFT_1273798 [Suillus paluster]|uniref:uncharacterized protein n=1 Tax=Suillus paluster TaxID=48578 RepID=UPI001B876D61|nr:uncharacterized protein EDB91DRAFT_1273798 [Suillus paluster]KAG1722406.1 hypothetical protein EDB91DRAFT_1273798 [Suillus paluster]
MSASTSFVFSYLLATVTTSIPASGDFTHRKQEDMDLLMKHELLVGPDGNIMGGKRVLWEEGIQSRTSSILDILIPKSSLKIQDLHDIRYIKKKDDFILYGSSILLNPRGITRPQWRLTHPFSGPLKKTKRNQQELQTNTEVEGEADEDLSVGEDMMEMDGSWSQKLYQTGEKHLIMAVKVAEEKNWEHLFRSVYYDTHDKVKAKLGSLPFHVLLEPRYWSSEFSTIAIPDPTDSQKPDLVLMDYRLKKSSGKEKSWAVVLTGVEITISELAEGKGMPIFLGVATKGYLMMREQPWCHFILLFSIANLKLCAHYLDCSGMIISAPILIGRDAVRFADVLNTMTLASHSALGFDPTIHVCNTLCSTTAHDNLPEGVDAMPIGAIGWVTDDVGEVYWIMANLWKSCGLFSRGTVCYHVQDKNKWEYALKDCWVDADIIEQEVNFLRAVDGVPNVVQLVKYWDIEYDGHIDSTSNICDHVRDHLPDSPIFTNKIHRCMLLTPCGLPLTNFKSVPELVNVFLDLVVAHKTMMMEWRVLHGDLSPNNLIIYRGKGYFIDFDHAKFIQLNNKAKDSRGTGTIPYISCHLLKLMGGIPTPDSIDHKASDDLESLFYILLKFMIIYNGPGGLTTNREVPPENAHRWHKVYVTMDKDGLGTSGTLKKEFLMDKAPGFEPAPYFQACRPILEDWRMAIGDAIMNSKDVSHNQICEIIQRGLDNIDNFPSPQISLPMPSTSPSASSPSSPAVVLGSQPHRSSRINHPAHSSIPSTSSSSFAPPHPPSVSSDRPHRSSRKKKQVSTS